jgi:predicted AlkP superfamily pyrophosphatase or phosphodiesterase
VTALPDWIREASQASKVFSVSRKDRAAVLMGGKSATAAYWYDEESGDFFTSTYYMRELPGWLKRFNEKGIPRSYFGKSWSPLQMVEDLHDSGQLADLNRFDHAFPHDAGSPSPSFFKWYGRTPLMDEYMFRLAKELIENESLGADRQVDYLSLSFSVLDSVGHEYGPHSAEVLDTICRLDRILSDLFRYLDSKVGLENTIIVLSSDHGVMDLPEYALTQGVKAHRVNEEDVQCLQQKSSELASLFGEEEDWFANGYYFNQAAVERKGLSQSAIEEAAAELFSQCAYVRRVWTRTELEKDPTEEPDPFWVLFRNSFHPERSPDLLFQMEKYYVGSAGTGTSHGSPYRYDTHVPIAFFLPGIRPARIEERVTTVDIAPTVASLLGLKAPETVDGRDLSRHFSAGE